mgnify:CR=1 FL=1
MGLGRLERVNEDHESPLSADSVVKMAPERVRPSASNRLLPKERMLGWMAAGCFCRMRSAIFSAATRP